MVTFSIQEIKEFLAWLIPSVASVVAVWISLQRQSVDRRTQEQKITSDNVDHWRNEAEHWRTAYEALRDETVAWVVRDVVRHIEPEQKKTPDS